MTVIGQVLWLTLPAILAGVLHMVAVKVDLWPVLKVPLDGGRTWRGRPIFGANKTWRGVVFMAACGATVGLVQGLAGGPWATGGAECFDMGAVGRALGLDGRAAHGIGYALTGTVLGLGYVLGELPNSFIKRQYGVKPGQQARGRARRILFLIGDRLDSVVGSLLLTKLAFPVPWAVVLWGVPVLMGVHLGLTLLLWVSGVKKEL